MIRVSQKLTINYNIIVSLTYCPYRGLMMNTMNSKIPKTNPYSDGDAPFFSACEKKITKKWHASSTNNFSQTQDSKSNVRRFHVIATRFVALSRVQLTSAGHDKS